MNQGVLPREREILTDPQGHEDLAILVEGGERFLYLFQALLRMDVAPDQVAEFQESANGTDDVGGDQAVNRWEIYLGIEVSTLLKNS